MGTRLVIFKTKSVSYLPCVPSSSFLICCHNSIVSWLGYFSRWSVVDCLWHFSVFYGGCCCCTCCNCVSRSHPGRGGRNCHHGVFGWCFFGWRDCRFDHLYLARATCVLGFRRLFLLSAYINIYTFSCISSFSYDNYSMSRLRSITDGYLFILCRRVLNQVDGK